MEPTRGGGDPAFLNRNSGKVKVFMGQHRPEHLVAELPMDPSRPLAAVRDEDAWTFMKDLVQNHRGELLRSHFGSSHFGSRGLQEC